MGNFDNLYTVGANTLMRTKPDDPMDYVSSACVRESGGAAADTCHRLGTCSGLFSPILTTRRNLTHFGTITYLATIQMQATEAALT